MVRISQSYAITLDSLYHFLDGIILSNDTFLQDGRHIFQTGTFFLSHSLNRNTRHFTDDISHIRFCHRNTFCTISTLPFFVHQIQLFFQRQALITITGCQFEILIANSLQFLSCHFFNFILKIQNIVRHFYICQSQFGTNFIHDIYRLVWEKAVCDIAFCQFDTCLKSLITECHTMMLLITILDISKNCQSLFCCSRLYDDLLKSSLQGSVFFDTVCIFLKGRSTYALNCTTSQSWLQNIGRIHSSATATSSYKSMYFIYKNDDIRIVLQFRNKPFDTFLKLSSILGTSHHRSKIYRHNPFVEQSWRSLLFYNKLRQSFYYSTFTHTWLTDEYGIIFLSTPDDFQNPLDFVLSSHYRIQFPIFSSFG